MKIMPTSFLSLLLVSFFTDLAKNEVVNLIISSLIDEN